MAFLLVGGILFGLLDPHLGFDLSSVALVLGLSLSLAVTTLGFALPVLLFMRRRYRDWGYLEIVPGAAVVAVVGVVVSRVVHFEPGYLYGIIGGLAFHREIAKRAEGWLTAISALFVLLVGIGAWLVRSPVAAAAATVQPSFWAVFAEAVLATTTVLSLESLVVSLLPMRFLEGIKLKDWNRLAWAALLGLALFAFVHILLRPTSGYVANTKVAPASVVVGLFVGFAGFSIAFWAYFRFRSPRMKPTEGSTEPGDFDLTGRL